ncbi:ArsR/SmtB family transcription factor [Fodinicola feengrottensis]|uniref:ArsR/SmtB family transcription factor n=1 Tax=Fodinicola feengrottensis TaxID=435914 RepID=UPI0013D0C48E|nr:metalloregulator ArsR/SmtB family transcription factor [Fodinicola feengrottensis]
MAQIFRALADPTRQRLLDRLHADNGQPLSALCRDLDMTRQGVTQHLAVLEAAGLVSAVRHGRQKLHYLNPVPLQEIHERWISRFEQPGLQALSALKRTIEGTTMDKPQQVYVTYIATTQEKLWAALTDPEVTTQYWAHRNISTWTKGESWEHQRLDGSGADVVGTILEVDPPRRLAHSWALPAEAGDPARTSRVTFDLEPAGTHVRLRMMTHDDLPADQIEESRDGWEMVLSSLKSLLETGKPLDFGW